MVTSIAAICYAIAAAAFLAFFVLLLTRWRGRPHGMLMAVASIISAAWAAYLAYVATLPDAPLSTPGVLEMLRSAAWFAYLIPLLGYAWNTSTSTRFVALGVIIVWGITLGSEILSNNVAASGPAEFTIFGRLVLAIVGMVLVEQLFRNTHPQRRWAIKFLCLGLGGIFACDFYLYADAMLFQQLNPHIWAARGLANTLVVILLAVAMKRSAAIPVNVTVSRGLVFYSAVISGSAIYLLTMSAAGHYIRYFGGTWGIVLQLTFLFAVIAFLFAMLFSGALRARLKVLLTKHFFRYHYDYREEWLRFTRTLSEDESGTQLRERTIQAIAELVESPGGALWLTEDSRMFEKVAHWNMPAASGMEPVDSPLCQFLKIRQWVIDVTNCDTSDTAEGVDIPDWLRKIPDAALVVPLILHEQLIGFVVLARSRSRINLNWEVNDILKTAGKQAASYVAQLEAAKALLVARQFESFNRMSSFVVHDLKNLIAQLSLLMSNSKKHKNNPAFQEDMLGTVADSIEKMNRLLVQLRGSALLEPAVPTLLGPLLRKIVAAKSCFEPAPVLELSDDTIKIVGHPARLERVIGHLVQNAIEATPPTGTVRVRLSQANASAMIEIIDSGCGMSDQFIQGQLFKPFESTKKTGMGIGTFETRQYIRELGGRIEVESQVGRGTLFRITLQSEKTAGAGEANSLIESSN